MIYDLYRSYMIYIDDTRSSSCRRRCSSCGRRSLPVEEDLLLVEEEDILLVHEEDLLVVQYMKHENGKYFSCTIYET